MAEEVVVRDRSERAYTWTVTAFYAVAIGANLWILWKTYGDGPEGELVRRRLRYLWRRISRPVREARDFQRQARHVEYEAYATVTDADPMFGKGAGADDSPGD